MSCSSHGFTNSHSRIPNFQELFDVKDKRQLNFLPSFSCHIVRLPKTFLFSRNCYFLFCSPDQTTNFETTNAKFLHRVWQIFTRQLFTFYWFFVRNNMAGLKVCENVVSELVVGHSMLLDLVNRISYRKNFHLKAWSWNTNIITDTLWFEIDE